MCIRDSRRILRPPCTWFTSIPAWNFPEQILMNAIRSQRCIRDSQRPDHIPSCQTVHPFRQVHCFLLTPVQQIDNRSSLLSHHIGCRFSGAAGADQDAGSVFEYYALLLNGAKQTGNIRIIPLISCLLYTSFQVNFTPVDGTSFTQNWNIQVRLVQEDGRWLIRYMRLKFNKAGEDAAGTASGRGGGVCI